MTMDTEKFKALLNEKYQWPCDYTFKFIVSSNKEEDLSTLFQDDSIMKKNSSTGKYISFTITKEMSSSDDVVKVYQRVGSIEGIVSL